MSTGYESKPVAGKTPWEVLAPRIQPLPTTHVARISDPGRVRPQVAGGASTQPRTLIRGGPKIGVRSIRRPAGRDTRQNRRLGSPGRVVLTLSPTKTGAVVRRGRVRRRAGIGFSWNRGTIAARPIAESHAALPARVAFRPSSGRSVSGPASIPTEIDPEANVTYRHGGRSPGFPGSRLQCCPSMGPQPSALREKGVEPR